ncbi:MAG: filamentous hemagglutinin N-terminal domain-containing protein, partial [Verrucomicrobiales bacterium]
MKRTAYIVALLSALFVPHQIADGGDILRGGAKVGENRAGGNPGDAVTAAQTARIVSNNRDALARTSKALTDASAMQEAARAAAVASLVNNLGPDPQNVLNTLPDVPDGLAIGGLRPLPGGPWTGADDPVQAGNNVRIRQRESQALLSWETFNVGRNTTLTFDQSAGGSERSKWIAFNQINDPSGRPSQILGQINADGQVYLINANGVIFG